MLSRLECYLGEGIVLLLVVMASCESGASLLVLLRLCMSLQNLEGFVLNMMDSRSCFNLVCCSCRMSSNISLFSVCILLTSCEGSWCLRCSDFSIESGAEAFHSSGGDMGFVVFDDNVS